MRNIVLKLWKDEEGPTAVEYALMLFLIVAAVTAALGPLRAAVVTAFNAATTALTNAGT
jgi:pilus assembly protein Flp/PilA